MFQELSDRVFRRHFESLRLNIDVVFVEEGVVVIDTRASHVEITPPTRVVTDTAMIDFGEKVVTMIYRGLGHTDADLVVSIGDVSFMGDLLEEGTPPGFDDGYPMSWPAP